MKWISLEARGWPDHTVLEVRLNDGHSRGPRLDGDVTILMQKGRDQASAVQIDNNGSNVVALVRNGFWRSAEINLAAFQQQGFDTVVAELEGRRVAKSLVQNPTNPATNPRGNQTPKTAIDATALDVQPTTDGKLCNISLAGIVTTNQQPVSDAQLDLYYNGRIEPECQLTPGVSTDANGRFSFTFAGKPADGKRAKLEIQIRGGIRRQLEVDIPEAPKEKKPTAITGLKILNAPNSQILCSGFSATVCLQAQFEENRPARSVTIAITANHKVNLNDATGVPIGTQVTACAVQTNAAGQLQFGVNFLECSADEVILQVSILDTPHSQTVTLKYKMI